MTTARGKRPPRLDDLAGHDRRELEPREPEAEVGEEQDRRQALAKSGTSDAAGIGVAEPKRVSATSPTSSSAADGIHCAMPPMFWTQRPDFMPTMLKKSAIEEQRERRAGGVGPALLEVRRTSAPKT